MAAMTKDTLFIQEWVAIAKGNNLIDGIGANFQTSLGASLVVSVANIEAVANALGALVIVEAAYDSGNQGYRELYSIRMAAGTAVLEALDAIAAADQEVIELASTTGFETIGDKYFLHDTVDIEKSEIVRNLTFINDDKISIVGDLEFTHQTSAKLCSIVDSKMFPIPNEIEAVRVLIINDDADCDIAAKIELARITGLA